jgi:hypothetical protein
MNVKLRKCLRASNDRSCKCAFSLLYEKRASFYCIVCATQNAGTHVIVQLLLISNTCALTNACLHAYVHVSVSIIL